MVLSSIFFMADLMVMMALVVKFVSLGALFEDVGRPPEFAVFLGPVELVTSGSYLCVWL